MNQIKFAHEAPLSLMPYVQHVTDYDYALASLFETIPGYFDFFKEAKRNGRYVILDNGVFEEGKAVDTDKYVRYIEELQPDEYIIPDVLEDYQATATSFVQWYANLGATKLPGIGIGVAQGKTLDEFFECYKFMSREADKIAISFDYSFYILEADRELEGITPAFTKWEKFAFGRQRVFDLLSEKKLLNTSKPHHCLGAALPDEFSYYCEDDEFSCIVTADTSNPVVQGLLHGRYPSHINLVNAKDTTKVKDLINVSFTPAQLIDVIANIIQFRLQNGVF